MTPFYLDCCKDLNWNLDQNLLKKMKTENETKLKVNYFIKPLIKTRKQTVKITKNLGLG